MADEDDHNPWTPEGARRLATAAEQLGVAIKAHAEAVASAKGQRDISKVFSAGDALLPAALAYVDAQFDYTGTGFPLGVLHQFAEDEHDDDEEDELAEDRPTSGVSVLRRHDFGITDEPTVMAAGRAAYLRVWPDDSEEDAAADVTHLGRALYQIAHARGWDSLDRVDGLRPLGGVTRVIDQEELLGADPDDWPPNIFATEGEVMFEQSDIWG